MITAKNHPCDLVRREFEPRRIRYAFHDIDGTHSLIRDWPPVMSIVLWDVIENGLPEDFDSEENCQRLINAAGTRALPETDRFCVESAGLSALTQMEWAIRRAIEEGKVDAVCDREQNQYKIRQIWQGVELFPDLPDGEALAVLLQDKTPRLFKFYEKVLNGFCRDRNLVAARQDPEKFRIKGSLAFLKYLRDNGVQNYFVTGAVVERGMGMFEEAETLGYLNAEDGLITDIIGSTWTKKEPKDVIMKKLLQELGARGEEVLVVGDGRAEISAGVEMGALCISRLAEDADYQRKLHEKLGTHIIVADYTDPHLKNLLISDQ